MDRVNMKLNPINLTYSHANNTLIVAVSTSFWWFFFFSCIRFIKINNFKYEKPVEILQIEKSILKEFSKISQIKMVMLKHVNQVNYKKKCARFNLTF
jgi:hypothetical protein